MLHITCAGMTIQDIRNTLNKAKEYGIENILALRGDLPKNNPNIKPAFEHAIDLVKFIRKEYGDSFCICVGGYPDGHTECTSFDDDIKHLKEKVDAGADFVITQMFYDFNQFKKFMVKAREIGIKCPIIPGFMTIQNYNTFSKMVSFNKIHVPEEIQSNIDKYKKKETELKEYGIIMIEDIIRQCLFYEIPGIHFYTLNLEKSVRRIITDCDLVNNSRRLLPWRRLPSMDRENEEIRPIFWANRPQSYINKTIEDEKNTGKWAISNSTALDKFESQNFDNYKPWMIELDSISTVNSIFVSFIDGKIPMLPWCENIDIETDIIKDKLKDINSLGFLTINSQV